jgi:hypothetical protein
MVNGRRKREGVRGAKDEGTTRKKLFSVDFQRSVPLLVLGLLLRWSCQLSEISDHLIYIPFSYLSSAGI